MKLSNLYEDKIKGLPLEMQEAIIKEAPHTRITGEIPDSLSFLRGAFVDLGFENMGLSREELTKLGRAFIGPGISMPGTGYMLRYTRTGVTVIEPDRAPVFLPFGWHDAVLVLGDDDMPKYVGKNVRQDQVGAPQ